MDSNSLLDSIIQKIVTGRSDWTPEELQYQKNNPREIEVALVKERLKVPIQCNCEGIMIVPYSWNISMLQQAIKELKLKRFLHASDAVALALYHNIDINGHICIITDDAATIEIGIYNLGDGMIEAVSAQWISKQESERLPLVCDTMLKDLDLTSRISQIILARTSPYHICVHNLERVFQRAVLQVSNLKELCNIGASVQQGVSKGYIKDVLLLQLISQAIGISDIVGSMVHIIPPSMTIPTRKTQTICISGNELSIRQGNNVVAIRNPIISTLHFNNTGNSQRRQVEITVEIDSNYVCHIDAKDLVTNEQIDRGYYDIDSRLNSICAKITRINDSVY